MDLCALTCGDYAQSCACGAPGRYRLALGPILTFWCEGCLIASLAPLIHHVGGARNSESYPSQS